MRLDRRVKIQLLIVLVISTGFAGIMFLGYMKAPATVFGLGRYSVAVQLPQAAGLYDNANVTYRGTEVGQVSEVQLTDSGVRAVLSLRSGVDIPSDVQAQVHSVSAIGEQYVALVPGTGQSRPLRDGDLLTEDRTSTPPDIDRLLNLTNNGLQAIPQDNLRVAVDEAYTAVHGLGPQIAQILRGGTGLAVDADKNLDAINTSIDQAAPLLDSQSDTADSIGQWAANLASVTAQLRTADHNVASILDNGAHAADQTRQLIDRLNPTVPVLLANLQSVGEIALAYNANIEQLLVLAPQGVGQFASGMVTNQTALKPAYGTQMIGLSAGNLNLPAPCATGFLPAQQRRAPALEDYPDRADGDLYCRVPQDSPIAVRGARNIPCARVPGKRAPTAAMCNSPENYVPLNDGFNWKGDPNATLSGQDIPQLPPGSATPQAAATSPADPALTVAQYDPATGTYTGPDGRRYTQADLAHAVPAPSLQSLLMPGVTP